MKDEVIHSHQTSRLTENQHLSNRVVYKCQKERNFYIRREVGDLIKKQLKIFFATEKLEKQIEDKNKDIIFTPAQSPIQKVNHFRVQQREKQWQKLRAFKIKNAERMKRLAERLKQKSLSHLSKSSENFHRMSRVQQRYQNNLVRQNQRIEQLKRHLMIESTKPDNKMTLSGILENQRTIEGIIKAKQKAKQKEQNQINTYLNKMKTLEQRKIQNEIKLELKKTQSAKKIPKYSLAMRIKEQQLLVKKWTNQYEKKTEAFQKYSQMLSEDKSRAIYERSIEKNQAKNEVIERKLEQEQRMAERRVQMMQEKIMKISKVPGRNSNIQNKSMASFNHNMKKGKQDYQKQQHSSIMREIYHVIQKLKTLNDGEKLKNNQISLLLENLDPSQNPQDYKELVGYLNSTKQKFFEQKRKQEEERMKKMKKNNQKLL